MSGLNRLHQMNHITIVNADTEYSLALPPGTAKLRFQTQDSSATRYAFVTGKVATPTAPYFTLKSGTVHNVDGLDLRGVTLYVANAAGTKVVEVETWR